MILRDCITLVVIAITMPSSKHRNTCVAFHSSRSPLTCLESAARWACSSRLGLLMCLGAGLPPADLGWPQLEQLYSAGRHGHVLQAAEMQENAGPILECVPNHLCLWYVSHPIGQSKSHG